VGDRASCGSKRGRGLPSRGPRTSRRRDAVEAFRRASLVRGGPVARSKVDCVLSWLSRFSPLLSLNAGTPILLVPTNKYLKIPKSLIIWNGGCGN
jgi:hypothetical protein